MLESEITKYRSLNQLAEADGIVILGGHDDVAMPLGELKQAFALSDHIYNRSFSELFVADAAKAFNECVADLCPDTILLHIGEADISSFKGNEAAFEENYRALIDTIKTKAKNCRIVIVSLKNDDHHATVTEINDLLQKIAVSETCEFEDISEKRAWNAKESAQISSFIYDIGFDRPLNVKRPMHTLSRIFFCYKG